MKSWPHAPSKLIVQPGTYFITASTYHKVPLYRGHRRLLLLQDAIFHYAEELGWKLEAWAIFANHYHLIGRSPEGEDAPRELTKRIHGLGGPRVEQT